MKNFFSEIENAKVDNVAGIAISELDTGLLMNSYGTRMAAGKKVSCHYHGNGDEWYIILSGNGIIHLADTANECLENIRSQPVKEGDIFCIPENTAHQLVSHTELNFIFLCPEQHLGSDRFICKDLA